MKKVLFFMLLLVIGLGAMAQQRIQIPEPRWTGIISDSPEAFQTQLISSTDNSIKVNVQVPGFYTTTVTTPKGEANVITVPKAVSTAHAGEPDMPMTGIPVMIGDKANMNVRVIDAQYIDYENMEVAPSKGDFPRTIDPATVPYTYGECYSQKAFFPASNVGLYEPYIIRDFRGQNIVVYPFAYNPVTKTLRVYYNMTVEMYKVDDHGTNVIATRNRSTVKLDPDFKSLYQRHFINYEESSAKYTALDEEGDLLIICYDNFISAMTDFVNWKKTRGVNTTIVGTSTAGSSYSAIKSYIQSQYNANNNLTHVLLVGDVAQIPGYSYSGGGSDYSGLGDNAYGQIVGNDIYNDVFIGRFSASTASRVTTQCNRVITYERDLTTSASWLQKGVGISRKENGSGHNSEDDYQHMDNIRTDLLNYGYTSVTQRYANLTGYDGSSSTISSDINGGVGIVNYANHGQETAWGANSSGYIYYANSHVNALTNENKLPFIWSVACLVGKYDHSSDCFAEAWMNATNNNNPTGAIGTLMSYISQPWIPPMWAQDECIDILAGLSSSGGTKHTWGGTSINGLMGIFDHYSTSEQQAVGTYQAWILYGDPSLMLRTKTPQDMTLTHNGTITIGVSTYTVNVSNGNGAVATITDANHNILGKATVSNGTATINLNSSNLTVGSELTLCVFGFNKVTKLGTIQVVGGSQYNITVTQPQHGTISAPAQAYANATVTLTANPDAGYCLSSWTVKKGNTNISVTNNQFTMPEGDVTVTATFVQGLQVTLASVEHGSISADPTCALQGTTINLTATPATGYEFNNWVVYKTGDPNTTVTVTGNSFTMPNYSVTVSATFVPGPVELTVYDGTSTNQYIPMYGYYFDAYTKSECIIPASQLTAMNGGAISSITFYPSSVATTNSTWSSTSQTVFIKEVSSTTLGGSFSGTTGATTVKQALLEMPTAGMPYTITFDAPYTYNGGNLLIGIYNTTKGSYNKVEWYGTSNLTSGVSAYGNNSNGLNSVGYTAQSFLPKTTFSYMQSTTPYVSLAPNSATILTGFTETLTASYGNVTGTPSITYSSSNTSVATVSGNGTAATVTAVAPGIATIIATMTVDGTPYTATCAVTVENPSYCTPNPTSRDGQGITSLTFGSGDYVVNNSNSNGLPASSPYYGDYTSMVGGYEADETATVTITYSTGSSTVYSYGTIIWVDWNKNYTFEDNEIVYTGTSAQGSNGTPQVLTATFTIPASQAADDYRMRIAGADSYFDSYISGTTSANHDPCFTSTWAVCHDYTLRVISASTDPVAITVSANPANGGTVTGAGTYDPGTTVTLTATANEGYTFTNWTRNGVVISTNATYSFTASNVAEYVANFTLNSYTITAAAEPSEGGIVTISSNRGNRDDLVYDFEEGWQGWTSIKGTAGTSTHNWMHNTEYYAYDSNGDQIVPQCHNSSSGMMLSESYISASTSGGTDASAVYPDNYLISPQFRLGGSFTFYAASRMSNYPAEKFSVLVSTSGNTSVNDFTQTALTVTLSDNSWNEYTIDLSTYSGMGYVAIRHYDCYDQHLLYVDDVTIVEGADPSTGSGNFNYGETCVVTATPNTDYNFVNWTENGTTVSSDASYSFTVTGDRDLVANFTTLPLPCQEPTNVAVSNIGHHSAEVSWTEGGEATSWMVAYKLASDLTFTEVESTEPTYTLTGLSVGTAYTVKVRPVCESEVESWSDLVDFMTEDCYAISLTQGEWSENFDNLTTSTEKWTGTTMGTEGDCWTWTRLVELPEGYLDTVPQIYYNSNFAHESNYSLRLHFRGVYAMPELDESININDLKMSFYLRQSFSFYTLLIGVMTDPADPETFVPVAHIDNGTSTSVEYIELDFANYQGEGRYIAFKNVRPSATEFDGNWGDVHSVNYIDDIKLSLKEEGDCVVGLPYEMDFEDVTHSTNALTGAMPRCWEMVQNDLDEEIPFDKMPQVYCKTSLANNGSYSLRMYNRCIYAMPELADTIDMSKVKLSMSVRQPNARYQLYVGVWSDGEFIPVSLVNNTTTGYEDIVCDFSNYDGPVGRIAFRNVLSKGKAYDYSYNYIDDIVVSYMGAASACDAVTSLNVTETFETYTQSTVAATGVNPTCWEVVATDVEMGYDKYPQVYYNPNFGQGSYTLRMADRCVFAMPELEDGIELGDVTLTMTLRQPNTQYQLEVGVWEVGYDENQEPIEQFVPVATFHNADNTVTEVSCDFSSYTGNGNRIAFHNTLKTANYNYSYNYLDDITLTLSESKIAESSNANVIDEMGVERYLEGIAVYPNPTTGELHIGAIDVEKVECYNQMGQLVAVYDNDRDINISSLSQGVYTLRITVPQGVTMRKVVKR